MTFEPQSIKVLLQNKHINLLDLDHIQGVPPTLSGLPELITPLKSYQFWNVRCVLKNSDQEKIPGQVPRYVVAKKEGQNWDLKNVVKITFLP